ncbi:hypothetical protein HDU96_010971 [Phlyctochytrium bullatum]|nr:hypothetical protein HDU96_010971 [Phlyctochytrium bullatum]
MWDLFRNSSLWGWDSVHLRGEDTITISIDLPTFARLVLWSLAFLGIAVGFAVSSWRAARWSATRQIDDANDRAHQALARAKRAETQAEKLKNDKADAIAMSMAYKKHALASVEHSHEASQQVRGLQEQVDSTRKALDEESAKRSEANEQVLEMEGRIFSLELDNEKKTQTIRELRKQKGRSARGPSLSAVTESALREQNAALRQENEILRAERQKDKEDLRRSTSERDEARNKLFKHEASIKSKGYKSVEDVPGAGDVEHRLSAMTNERDEAKRKLSTFESTLKRKGYNFVAEVPKARCPIKINNDGVKDWSEVIPELLASVSNLKGKDSQSVKDEPKTGNGDFKTADGYDEFKIRLQEFEVELSKKGYKSVEDVPKKDGSLHGWKYSYFKLEKEKNELESQYKDHLSAKGYENLEAVPKATDVKKLTEDRDEARSKLADFEGQMKAKGYATVELVPTGEDTKLWKKRKDEADSRAIKLVDQLEALDDEMAMCKASLRIEEAKSKKLQTDVLRTVFASGVLSKFLRGKLATLKEALENTTREHATASGASEARITELQAALQATQDQTATLNDLYMGAQAQIQSLEGMLDQGRAEYAALFMRSQEAEAAAYELMHERQQYAEAAQWQKQEALAALRSEAEVYIGGLEHQLNEKRCQLDSVAERVRYFESVSDKAKRDRLVATTMAAAAAGETDAAQCA